MKYLISLVDFLEMTQFFLHLQYFSIISFVVDYFLNEILGVGAGTSDGLKCPIGMLLQV